MQKIFATITIFMLAISVISLNENYAFAQVGYTNTGDTIPPQIIVPSNMTVMVNNDTQTVVRYNVTAVDNVDGIINATCTPASGSIFPLGNTSVTCNASDRAGNTATKSFLIDVINPSSAIPSWVKKLAALWCDGTINANGFVQAIQYLIDSHVIIVPLNQTQTSTNNIPSWVKMVSCFWSQSQITDGDFLSAIQYLVSVGIIKVGAATQEFTQTSVTPNPATYSGTAITFTARVNDTTNAQNTPTGTVSWSDNSAGGTFSPTSCTLSSATCTASYTAAANATGSITISADYIGDSTHYASSGTSSLTINATTDTTTATISPNPATVLQGSSVTLSVIINDTTNAANTPTGTVSWSDNSAGGTFSPTSCTLSSATCTASYTAAANATGSITINANYTGDQSHSSSMGTSTVTINSTNSATDTTTATISPNPLTLSPGLSATLSVIINDTTNAQNTPTGTVSWSDNGAGGTFSPTSCTLSSATCTTSYTAAANATDSITISANYTGDDVDKPSTGTSQVQIS